MGFKKEFENLLATTTLSSESSMDEAVVVWGQINSLLLPNIPQQLFRFRTCSADSIMSFQTQTISTCVPNAFKDKYDSLVFVDKKSIETKLRELTIPEALIGLVQNEEICNSFEKVVGKESVEQVRNEALQSPKEWLAKVRDNIERLVGYTLSSIDANVDYMRKDRFCKIACFSEDVKSLRMWDTYADGYRGFALEYDFREFHNVGSLACPNNSTCQNERRNFSHLFPVVYTDRRYDATDNVISLVQRDILQKMGRNEYPPIDQLFWYKPYLYKNAEYYAHEKEWRMISRCPASTSSDYTEISDLKTLRAIYYGPNMEKRHKDFLRSVAGNMKLREYDVSVDPYSPDFELKVVPCQ